MIPSPDLNQTLVFEGNSDPGTTVGSQRRTLSPLGSLHWFHLRSCSIQDATSHLKEAGTEATMRLG